jgi:arylsulfatase A-like enzyme
MDGYDVGIRYADAHFGMLLEELERQGVLDETAIIISVDHGENQGELNIYADHHTADPNTARVPLVIRWPGLEGGRVDRALHYQSDMAASVLELAGADVPERWDGRSFADALRRGEEQGREFLVSANCAWTCQRTVRWGDWCLLRTYHDGLKELAPRMLFDVARDPHLTEDLAAERPEVVGVGMEKLDRWHAEMMDTPESDVDPMWTVIREGGPYHTRGRLASYCEHLRETDRARHAETLLARHGG